MVNDPYAAAAIGATAAFVCFLALMWAEHFVRGRRTQMDPARERFINQLIADINTDGFEALVSNGTVSRAEADMVYKRLGNHLKAYDLLPRRTLTIPQEIRARLWDMWTQKKVPMPTVDGGKKKRSFT